MPSNLARTGLPPARTAMKDQKQIKPLSPEEQLHEARQDKSGRITRYLELAEKMLGRLDHDDLPQRCLTGLSGPLGS